MHCPQCGKEMHLERNDVSHNSATALEYNRLVYKCLSDDVWVTVEIPTQVEKA